MAELAGSKGVETILACRVGFDRTFGDEDNVKDLRQE
jgi:hypothetical protein